MLQAASKRRDWIQMLVFLNKLQITKLQNMPWGAYVKVLFQVLQLANY
jgi:hypothetical protein